MPGKIRKTVKDRQHSLKSRVACERKKSRVKCISQRGSIEFGVPAPVTPSEPASRGLHFPAVFRRIAGSRLAAPALLFVVCCGFCWKLVLSSEYTWLDNHDVTDMDVPRLQFQQVTWHEHEFPLWDPHLWCGQPFLGEIAGAAFPLNWPLFLLKPNANGQLSFRQLHWYFVALHFLGALFAYWLCRDLELSPFASLLGGFVFSFSGFFAVTLWPEVLSGLLIAPLVLLFLLRVLRRDHPFPNAALCGMFLGIAWLSGHHEIPTYLSLAVAAIWLYDLLSQRARWRRSLALASTAILFTILTSGFQTVPGYEYAKLAFRWVGIDHPVEWNDVIPYRIHASYSLAPSALPAIVLPWGGRNTEPYTGVVVLSLAVIAVLTRWQTRWVRLFTSLALAGLLLALGGWNVFHGILYAVLPLFGKARNPDRLVSMFGLGMAILSAFGFDCVRADLHAPLLRKLCYILLSLAGLVAVLALVAPVFQQPGPGDYAFMMGLVALLFAMALLAGRNGSLSGPSVGVAVMVLAFLELGNLVTPLYQDRTANHRESLLPNLTQFRDIADFLRHEPGPVRVYAIEVTDAFNLGDWEGIDTLTGFGAGITKNIFSLDWPSVRTQNLLAVGYSLSRKPPRADQQVVFRGSSGVSVLRNVDALPRVRITHQVLTASSAKDVAARVNDPSFDARNTVLLTGSAPALQSCAGEEQARVSRRTANSVVIDARLACRGMLILADTWYPGWVATVDDRSAPVYQAYSALRGVILEPGNHHVEFHYRPLSALIGAAMTAAGILGACILALWRRRSDRQ